MVINVLISILLWGAVAISFFKMLKISGVTFGNNKFSKWLTDKEIKQIEETVSFKEILKVFLIAFGFRIFIYIASVCAMMLFSDDKGFTFNNFLTQWKQWDAAHYQRIAELGYSGYIEKDRYLMIVFFPLYPYVVAAVNAIFKNYMVSALLTSSVCYSVACCYLYSLVSMDYGKGAAKKAVLYISVFPFAFFFGSMMTESIFFMTTVACFYYIRKHMWKSVFVFGVLSALSRLIGVFVIIPAAIEWCEHYKPFLKIREKKWKALWKDIYSKVPFIVLICLGTLIYFYMNYKVTGDPLMFLKYQKDNWHNGNTYFAKNFVDVILLYTTLPNYTITKASIWIPSLLLFVASLSFIVYYARRLKSIYVVYFSAYLVVNYSLIWPISLPRYMSVALPLFVILGILGEKHKWLDKSLTIGFSVLMGIYITGYLFSKQIF